MRYISIKVVTLKSRSIRSAKKEKRRQIHMYRPVPLIVRGLLSDCRLSGRDSVITQVLSFICVIIYCYYVQNIIKMAKPNASHSFNLQSLTSLSLEAISGVRGASSALPLLSITICQWKPEVCSNWFQQSTSPSIQQFIYELVNRNHHTK